MMSCTLRIKSGDTEIDFTGEELFAEKHLLPLLQPLIKALERGSTAASSKALPHSANHAAIQSQGSHLTTSTAATKLGSKSGTDLAIAAGYVLHRKNKESFTRNELIQEMKSAKSYFQVNFVKNLSNSLDTLTKNGKFLHQGGENYALSGTCKADLDQKFA
jgi:hypothetical protein